MQEHWDQCPFTVRFLSPYSPVLNAIEEYWSQMKSWTTRTPLESGESYVQRLEAACARITTMNCLNFVKHTKKYWLEYPTHKK